MADYIDIVYSKERKPFTSYPEKLINFIINKYGLTPNLKILEIGCGRGEFIKVFEDLGFDSYGIDLSDYSNKVLKKGKFFQLDLLTDNLPFQNESFDIIYSKSVIEHFHFPEKIIELAKNLLKKNGIIITLTPEWRYNVKDFYEDYTHRTPFSKESMTDILLINGFKDVEVESFKQLPSLWHGNIFLKVISEIARLFSPSSLRNKNKFIKFSKEIMLLSKATK